MRGPTRLSNGAVLQSGLPIRRVGDPVEPDLVELAPLRAVVVATHLRGEAGNRRNVSVECDVILVDTGRWLFGLPVRQAQHGVNNVHGLWVPRPTTRLVSDPDRPLNLSAAYSRRGTYVGAISSLADLDGDMVLVNFLGRRRRYPFVEGALPHERSNRVIVAGEGWREADGGDSRGAPRKDEFFTHHYGAEFRVNERGDVLFDTVGAYSDPTSEDATDPGGQFRVRVKSTERLTVEMDGTDVLEVWKDGGQVRIDLGEGATQRIPLGDDQVQALHDALDAVLDFAQGIATATPAPPNSALTVADVNAEYLLLVPKITSAKNALSEALSDLAKTRKS